MPLVKEYTLNLDKDPHMIEGLFLNKGLLQSLGSINLCFIAGSLCGRQVGVASGGSLQMWKAFRCWARAIGEVGRQKSTIDFQNHDLCRLLL